MASQVSHIVYAKKYFEKHPMNEIESDFFFLGCVFPDIRRIDKNIKRKDTHLRFDALDLDFEKLSPFEAGWKFHLYCDMKREEILNKYNFYALENTAEIAGQAAKMLEDELIYDDYDNWEKIVNYFNNPPFMPVDLPISEDSYTLWYAILAKYMKQKPNSKTMRIFLSKMLEFGNSVEEVIEKTDKLRESKKVIEILNKVKEEII